MIARIAPEARPKRDRIETLRRVGVPKQSIARVMNVDYPEERMSRYMVDAILRGHVPLHWREVHR
jgi:hypothetical protein